jgi:hypothetical protein
LIELWPCKHTLCLRCFHKYGSPKVLFHCPSASCVQHVASSVFEGEEVTHPSPNEDIKYNPDAHLDPVRHWIVEGAQDNTGIVYSIFKNAEGGATTYLVKYSLCMAVPMLDAQSRENVVKMFARVFHPLLFNEERLDKEAGLPNMDESSQQEFTELAFREKSLALPCLHALSTGEVFKPEVIDDFEKNGSGAEKSLWRGLFVAKEC